MKNLDADVLKNSTPPSCWQLLDGTTNGLNKCMGNADAICKTVGYHKIKKGLNTKAGFMLWHKIIQLYILYKSFRIYMYSKIENKIPSFVSFRIFQ